MQPMVQDIPLFRTAKAFEAEADEIVFAEGDLYFNEDDYQRVCSADKVWLLLIEIQS